VKKIFIDKIQKVSFISLGCPKNLVDSEVMLGGLTQAGFYICENYEDSDIIVINTCGFIKDAEDESLKVIGDAISLKKEGKIKGIVVTGCLSQRYGNSNEIFKGVDAILGIGTRDRLPDICLEILRQKKDDSSVSSSPIKLFNKTFPSYEIDKARLRLTPKHFAYARISDGCNRTCSFCVIPKIRGGFRSKPMEIILDEVKELVQDGAKEIILIGQDTSAYGIDIYNGLMLPKLIDEISNIVGVQWIRLLYCYPTTITDDIIKVVSQNPKVVKYIDLPIQHTRNKILKLMGRGISESLQKEIIYKLRKEVDGIFIRTSIIVGFPGETTDDFEELCSDIRMYEFERLGAFRFSREVGTAAFDMVNQVSDEEKECRFQKLMLIQEGITRQKNRELVGKYLKVIVDTKDENGYIGRTYGDAPDVDGIIKLEGSEKTKLYPGLICEAKVIGINGYDLVGEIRKAEL